MNQRSYPVPLIAVGLSALALSAKVLIPSSLHMAQPQTVRLALRSWRREIMGVLRNVRHIVLARGVANGARDEDIREAVPKADIPFSYAGLAGRFLPRSLAALVRPPSITH
jgi:hypothetical protein